MPDGTLRPLALPIHTVFLSCYRETEPEWEFKWAAWDEVKLCFVPTPVWLTDEGARGDWYAYDMCAHRLEHTKRDRNHSWAHL